jgi:hypothetical protein
MNERIKELAEQAKLKTELWNNPEPFVIYKEDVNYPGGLEKFAELIVRECMACSTWVGKNNTNTVEPIHTAQAINQRIKQQFGVEE